MMAHGKRRWMLPALAAVFMAQGHPAQVEAYRIELGGATVREREDTGGGGGGGGGPTCSAWVNGQCGASGGCPDGQMFQSRTCSEGSTLPTSQCVVDSSCTTECQPTSCAYEGCGPSYDGSGKPCPVDQGDGQWTVSGQPFTPTRECITGSGGDRKQLNRYCRDNHAVAAYYPGTIEDFALGGCQRFTQCTVTDNCGGVSGFGYPGSTGALLCRSSCPVIDPINLPCPIDCPVGEDLSCADGYEPKRAGECSRYCHSGMPDGIVGLLGAPDPTKWTAPAGPLPAGTRCEDLPPRTDPGCPGGACEAPVPSYCECVVLP